MPNTVETVVEDPRDTKHGDRFGTKFQGQMENRKKGCSMPSGTEESCFGVWAWGELSSFLFRSVCVKLTFNKIK